MSVCQRCQEILQGNNIPENLNLVPCDCGLFYEVTWSDGLIISVFEAKDDRPPTVVRKQLCGIVEVPGYFGA